MTWLSIISMLSAMIYVVGSFCAIYFEFMRHRVVSEKDKRRINLNQFVVGLVISLPLSILCWQFVHDDDYLPSILASFIFAGLISLLVWALIYGAVRLLFATFGGISKIRRLG